MDSSLNPFVKTRRAIIGWGIEGWVEGMSRAARRLPVSDPARYGVEVIRDVPYKDTNSRWHLADIYRPRNVQGPLVPLFYGHGGGFEFFSKETHWPLALSFARHGYLVFLPNYRLAPRHPFPAAPQDLFEAFLWFCDHASQYRADLSRLILAGDSAGANLVAALRWCASTPRPEPFARAIYERNVLSQVTISFSGLLQVSESQRFSDSEQHPQWKAERAAVVEGAYLHGARYGSDEPARPEHALADPLLFLESDHIPERPLGAWYGSSGDNDILQEDTRRLQRAVGKRGLEHQMDYYPGQGHVFQALLWKELARKSWKDCFAFLDRVIGLPHDSTP